jgi:hypothetical protein
MKTLFLAVCALLFSGFVFADTVILNNGQQLEGKVLKRTEAGIELQVAFGTMFVSADKILRIEADTPEAVAAREKKTQAEREFAAKMREEGKVEHKGRWVTEKEKAAEEEKLAAAKKKKDEERAAAKKKAEEALAAKKKADEERQLAAARALEQYRQQQLATGAGTETAADRYRQRRQRADRLNDNRHIPIDPNDISVNIDGARGR